MQASGVELIDREDTDAALGTSWAANEPLAAAARRVCKRGIDDLNQLLVLAGVGKRRAAAGEPVRANRSHSG